MVTRQEELLWLAVGVNWACVLGKNRTSTLIFCVLAQPNNSLASQNLRANTTITAVLSRTTLAKQASSGYQRRGSSLHVETQAAG